jgi:hypothetical protein
MKEEHHDRKKSERVAVANRNSVDEILFESELSQKAQDKI